MGHIERLPSGLWRELVSVNGTKRWTPSQRTKAEARHAAAELRLELGGTAVSNRTMTVGEMVAGHLAEAAKTWSPSTLADTKRVIDRLPDTFTNRRVRDVTPAILAGLYRQLIRDGWTPHRVKRAHMGLSVSFAEAVVYGWCTSNPCRDTRPPSTPARDVTAPSHEAVRAILAHADDKLDLFLRLSVMTGARRGELVALQWPDIRFDAREILIARSLVQLTGGGFHIGATKTGAKGHRRLALDDDVLMRLRHHHADATIKAENSRRKAEPLWVFSHDSGATPWRPDYVSRLFRQARDRAGVEGVRLHDARHYVATTMLQDGEPAIDVAAQLGHASVATTLSVYAQYLPGRGRDAAERRAARLAGE